MSTAWLQMPRTRGEPLSKALATARKSRAISRRKTISIADRVAERITVARGRLQAHSRRAARAMNLRTVAVRHQILGDEITAGMSASIRHFGTFSTASHQGQDGPGKRRVSLSAAVTLSRLVRCRSNSKSRQPTQKSRQAKEVIASQEKVVEQADRHSASRRNASPPRSRAPLDRLERRGRAPAPAPPRNRHFPATTSHSPSSTGPSAPKRSTTSRSPNPKGSRSTRRPPGPAPGAPI